jgi:tetratricopeptide (TPR) repeat protein
LHQIHLIYNTLVGKDKISTRDYPDSEPSNGGNAACLRANLSMKGKQAVKRSTSAIARDLLQQGILANERGDTANAILLFSQSFQLVPGAAAYYHRGYAYRQNKQPYHAYNDLNLAIQLNPESVDAHLQRADIRSDLEDLTAPAKTLRR